MLRITIIERNVDSRFDRNDIALDQPTVQPCFETLGEAYVALLSAVGQSWRSLPR
jgi:hypothetical protein